MIVYDKQYNILRNQYYLATGTCVHLKFAWSTTFNDWENMHILKKFKIIFFLPEIRRIIQIYIDKIIPFSNACSKTKCRDIRVFDN